MNKRTLKKLMDLGKAAENQAQAIYCTTYCNKGHVVRTGRPVGHECRVIPPRALKAEIAGDFGLAIQLMQARS